MLFRSLADAFDTFPAGTIHLAVVDPGVGCARRAIAAEIGSHKFVCPDNGLLTQVLQRQPLRRAVQLDQSRWWKPNVSSTFHGRDIYAPVAAAWSLGHDLSEYGSPIAAPLIELPLTDVEIGTSTNPGSGRLHGRVLSIDHFGNLITTIPQSAIPIDATQIEVQIAQRNLNGIDRCYADRSPGECIALFGSSGRLEIAIVNGHAARNLGVGIDEPVAVCWKGSIR